MCRALQRCPRVRCGAPLWRSALRADSPAMLAQPACRRTRCVHFVHCAQTAAASQITKHACPSAGVRPAALRFSAPQRRTAADPRAPLRDTLCRYPITPNVPSAFGGAQAAMRPAHPNGFIKTHATQRAPLPEREARKAQRALPERQASKALTRSSCRSGAPLVSWRLASMRDRCPVMQATAASTSPLRHTRRKSECSSEEQCGSLEEW